MEEEMTGYRCESETRPGVAQTRHRGQWKKVAVDVMVTSTNVMNKAFKIKDDKYRERATKDTREKKVMMAMMVPMLISHDGAVHRDTIRRWKNFAPDMKVDWVRMAQSIGGFRNNWGAKI